MILRPALVAFAVAAATAIVFAPSALNDFVAWDDNLTLLANLHYRGLGPPQLRWMVTTTMRGHWIPLTWLTFGIDYVLWGMHPAGYHLTSLVIHAAAAAVFALVVHRLYACAMPAAAPAASAAGAAVAALFFGLHPLRVESVAWATERRDVLSGFWYLVTVLLYLRAVQARGDTSPRWLGAALVTYALALASKAMVMTLPLALLVLDVYPLRRLSGRPRDWATAASRRVFLEKAPFLVLAVAAAIITVLSLRREHLLTATAAFSVDLRVAAAAFSALFYVAKTLAPVGLTPVYELPDGAQALDAVFVVSGVTVLAITAALYVMRSRWPAGLAAWVAYVVTLAPVSGLATWSQAGRQVVADRYSYLACLPWAVLVGGGVCVVLSGAATVSADSQRLRSHGGARAGIAAGVAAWIVALAALTVPQIGVWRDGETLWRYALEVDPDCALCHSQLGAVLGNRGAVVPALEHFERAVAIRPEELVFRSNHALALLKVGRASEAAEAYRALTARRPHDVELLNRFGAALLQANDPRGAAIQFERAVALEPGNTLARGGAARAYLAAGETVASRPHLEALRGIDAELAREVDVSRLTSAPGP